MEIFFVYGLVLIFFIALPVVIFILMKEPEREPDTETQENTSSHTLNVSRSGSNAQVTNTIMSYGLLAAIFALLFIISITSQRQHAA